eukprot:jgi/Galph1/3289/GphlegSOOS_G1974.1
MRIEHIRSSSSKKQRVAIHSHVKGLGLAPDGTALHCAAGFVGQEQAREAAGVVLELVPSKKMAGRALLLVGAPATGKTALTLSLKVSKGTKQLKLDASIYEGLLSEKVTIGDVIHIDANSGAVRRVGRIVQDLTLHDFQTPRKLEITDKLRMEVSKIVSGFIQQGIAELIPGVLFLDEVHVLDLLLATNRGMTEIRETDVKGPHGLPLENMPITEDSLTALTDMSGRRSLRYAVQLLTPAEILSRVAGRESY